MSAETKEVRDFREPILVSIDVNDEVRVAVNDEVQMMSGAWLNRSNVSAGRVMKATVLLGLAVALSVAVAYLLASPVMGALGMSALLG